MTPESSPLIAASLVCRECGKTMKMKVIFKKRGQKQVVSHLEYTCHNDVSGCNYKVESTAMIQGEMIPMRADGTPVQVPE